MGLAAGGEAFLEEIDELLKGRKRGIGMSEARIMERKNRGALLQKALAEEKDDRLRVWLRVRLLGETRADLAKELGYSGSAGSHQTVPRLEDQRSKNKTPHKKLITWSKTCNAVD